MSNSCLKQLLIIAVVSLLPLKSVCETPAPKAHHYYFDDVAQFAPTAGGIVLSLAGVKARNPWRERIAVTVTSMIINEALVQTFKHTIHSTRPDGTDRHSFPSGHASRAFRGAEVVRTEFGWGWGAGAYAIAAGVGALRIHHHRHRFGDVVGGAAIGVLSARAAYWLLPLERRLFKWDKTNVTTMAAPIIDPTSRTYGASLALIF